MPENLNVLENAHRISKKLIADSFSDEEPYFETVWHVMSSLIQKWWGMPPEEWPFGETAQTSLANLGFAPQTRELVTPVIIGVVSACIFDIWGTKLDDPDRQILEMIEEYATRFGLKGKPKKTLKEIFPGFLKKITEEIGEIQKPCVEPPEREYFAEEVTEYEVYVNGKYDVISRKDVLDLELQKEDFLVWAWVDDEKSEIFIDKERAKINPDTFLWKLLALILKRVGKDLLKDDIRKEVGNIAIPQHLKNLKKATNHKLDNFIEGKYWRYTIKSFKSCLICKKT